MATGCGSRDRQPGRARQRARRRGPGPGTVRHGRRRPRFEPAAFLERLSAEHPFQIGQAVADHPRRAGRVVLLRVLGVRQPFDPVPVAQPVSCGEHRDPQVLGRVKGGQLRDHRPDQRTVNGHVTVQADPGEAPQVDARPACPRSPCTRAGTAAARWRTAVQVLHRLGLRRRSIKRQPLLAQADAHLGEVGVVGPPLPEPVGGHQRPTAGPGRGG